MDRSINVWTDLLIDEQWLNVWTDLWIDEQWLNVWTDLLIDEQLLNVWRDRLMETQNNLRLFTHIKTYLRQLWQNHPLELKG